MNPPIPVSPTPQDPSTPSQTGQGEERRGEGRLPPASPSQPIFDLARIKARLAGLTNSPYLNSLNNDFIVHGPGDLLACVNEIERVYEENVEWDKKWHEMLTKDAARLKEIDKYRDLAAALHFDLQQTVGLSIAHGNQLQSSLTGYEWKEALVAIDKLAAKWEGPKIVEEE